MTNRLGSRLMWGVFAVALCSCDSAVEPVDEGSGETPPISILNDVPISDVAVALQAVASGLARPTDLAAPVGDPRLFVLEQPGRIRVVSEGGVLEEPLLDITDRVGYDVNEMGLLGLTFDPDYQSNRRFFVVYSAIDGSTRVEAYRTAGGDAYADPGSAELVLRVTRSAGHHYGGQIVFGPDGMLYVSIGDGDVRAQEAQEIGTLLGSLVRLDVSIEQGYRIPADNPFTGSLLARGEIFHFGLRNPWRFAFDPDGGWLYVSDVGHGSWEEVNVQPIGASGLNFGWPVVEGPQCSSQLPREILEPFIWGIGCNASAFTAPTIAYGREAGCAIIGGYVYRGTAIPALRGHYVYGDLCAGWLRTFRIEADGTVADPGQLDVDRPGDITSFGLDGFGELYVLTGGGTVFKLVPRS